MGLLTCVRIALPVLAVALLFTGKVHAIGGGFSAASPSAWGSKCYVPSGSNWGGFFGSSSNCISRQTHSQSEKCKGGACCNAAAIGDSNCEQCQEASSYSSSRGKCTKCKNSMFVNSDGVCEASSATTAKSRGDTCSSNGECASNTCTHWTCEGTTTLKSKGEWCRSNGECASNKCTYFKCEGTTTTKITTTTEEEEEEDDDDDNDDATTTKPTAVTTVTTTTAAPTKTTATTTGTTVAAQQLTTTETTATAATTATTPTAAGVTAAAATTAAAAANAVNVFTTQRAPAAANANPATAAASTAAAVFTAALSTGSQTNGTGSTSKSTTTAPTRGRQPAAPRKPTNTAASAAGGLLGSSTAAGVQLAKNTGNDADGSNGGGTMGAVVGCTVAVVVLLGLVVATIAVRRRRRQTSEPDVPHVIASNQFVENKASNFSVTAEYLPPAQSSHGASNDYLEPQAWHGTEDYLVPTPTGTATMPGTSAAVLPWRRVIPVSFMGPHIRGRTSGSGEQAMLALRARSDAHLAPVRTVDAAKTCTRYVPQSLTEVLPLWSCA